MNNVRHLWGEGVEDFVRSIDNLFDLYGKNHTYGGGGQKSLKKANVNCALYCFQSRLNYGLQQPKC